MALSDFRAAVACVNADGPSGPVRGTAFLIDRRYALTALHVIADRRSDPIVPYLNIELGFPSHRTRASWVVGVADAQADWALLRLDDPVPPEVEPLLLEPLDKSDLDNREVSWRSLGFPDAKPDGIEVGGIVRSIAGSVDGQPALQLFSQEAAAGSGAPVSGLSGAPVIVDGAVAGLLRWATLDSYGQSVAGTLYACPAATIRSALAKLNLADLALALSERPCPYPGLVSFQRDQSALFFGRSSEITWLLRHVEKQHFLLVIGPSGSGKSSLIQAGLLSRLPPGLVAHTLRPGTDPLRALDAPLTLLPQLVESNQRLLLFVDQLEELFVYPPRQARQAFCQALQKLRIDPRCVLILGLRADFFPDLMQSELWPIDPEQRLEVAPLRGASLLQAIAEPAARVGVYLEPALQERLLADAANEPGVLPLLQETLVLLWRQRSGRRLTLLAYQSLADSVGGANSGERSRFDVARSGLGAAIATHAEAVLAEMNDAQRRLARRIFLRLVLFGEGRPNTRRQQAQNALRAPEDDAAMFDEVLRRLIDSRLLTASSAELTDLADQERRIDLAHEILLSAWPRLDRWISELRQAERTRRRLEDSAAEWQRLRERGGGLLDAVEVREASEWVKSLDAGELGVSGEVKALVLTSQQALDRAEKERRETERREAEQALTLVRERAQAQSRLWRVVTTLAVIAVAISSGLSIWAFFEWYRAERESKNAAVQSMQAHEQARLATARRLAVQARTQIPRALDLALLLALAGQRSDSDSDTQSALLATLQRAPQLLRIARGPDQELSQAALSPDGKTFAAAGLDGRVYQFDARSGQPSGPVLSGAKDKLYAVAWSPDGKRIAAGGQDRFLYVWDSASGQPLGTPISGPDGPIRTVAWSTDGRRLATGDEDRAILLLDAVTGLRVLPPLRGHKSAVESLAFRADGRALASASDDSSVRIWDTRSGEPIGRPLEGHDNVVRAVAWSPDGRLLASSSWDRTVRLWNAQTSQLIGSPLGGHQDTVATLAFSHDGKLLVSGSWDRSVQVWDVETQSARGPRRFGHAQYLVGTAFSTDDSELLTVSGDGTTLRWAVSDRPILQEAIYESPSILNAVAWSADAKLLAVAGESGTLMLFDSPSSGDSTLKAPRMLAGHSGRINSVAISPDSQRLASAGDDQTIRLWRLPEGTAIDPPLRGHSGEVRSVAFSADGKMLVSASYDETVRRWDAQTGQPIGNPLHGHSGAVMCAAFSMDGKRLVSGGLDKTAILWDAETGQPIGEPLRRHDQTIRACAFSPDGRYLLTGSEDQTVRLWDAKSGQPIGEPLRSSAGQIAALALRPDGRWAATASDDGRVQLWDITTATQLEAGMVGHKEASGVAFSPDGQRLASVGPDRTLRVWDVDPRSWAKRACALAGRNLSPVEQRQFHLLDPTPLCP